MSGAPARFTAFLVPHTHWDREWYQPFETFRARLVSVIDRLVELLEADPAYPPFLLDGQTIILRDYLEVRPEQEGTLRALIAAGRIRIGPWYVLADEFLVSPEALIRNLALGARQARAFGDRLGVAYTPDSFGHVSQLPLLARGFGLDAVVFERGVGDEGERLGGEFTWLGADGATRVLATHLVATYSAVAAIGHGDWEMTDPYDGDRAARHARAALFGADGVDLAYLPAWFRASLERVRGGATAYATTGAALLLNGSDHLYPQANVPEVLRDLNARVPDVSFEAGDPERFVARVRNAAPELACHQGEFRGSRYQHILSGVLSARLYLKRANEAAQVRLEKYAEPLAALAWLEGAPHPQELLRHAWTTLLENHPHDSICGCSVDDVHHAMMTRFAAVGHVAAPLEAAAERALVGPDGRDGVAVFNPHPFPARRAVDVRVPLADDATEVGLDGRATALQAEVEETPPPGRRDGRVRHARLTFVAELPPLGWTGYRLQAAAGEPAPAEAAVRVSGDDGRPSVENELLRLDVSPERGPELLHKASGARYPLALRFEDEADAGDSYDFSPTDEAPLVIDGPAGPARLVERGPARAVLRLDYRAEVPARLRPDRRAREGTVALPLTVDLIVEAARPSLGVRVRLDNRARDHRLRLVVDSGCVAEAVHAEGHFDVLRRPVRPPAGEGWFQAPQGTQHQRRFVAVFDGDEAGATAGRGLAVLNRGLPEYEATLGEGGVALAVTLLRAVGWLSRDDLTSRPEGAGPALETPGAQCLGEHELELALLPLAGPDPWAALMREADLFAAPPRARAVARAPAPASWLHAPEPLVMTSLTRAAHGGGLLVRLWNPSPRDVEGSLTLGFSPREAHEVRLDETRLRTIELAGSTVPLSLRPQEVRTVELVTSAEEVMSGTEGV